VSVISCLISTVVHGMMHSLGEIENSPPLRMSITDIDKLLNMSDFITRSDLEETLIVTRSWVLDCYNRVETLLFMCERTILDSIIVSSALVVLVNIFQAKFVFSIFNQPFRLDIKFIHGFG
jgi:hypothetical protein